MKAKDIIKLMDSFAPDYLIDDWDNTGFQIGNEEKEVKKILLSLDLDREVYDYSQENEIDMIINHHPILFRPIGSITNRSHKGKLIYDLIREDIVVYNAHSNLDQALGGMNYVLRDLFELRDWEILSVNPKLKDPAYGYGVVGDIDEIDLATYIDLVKSKLKVENVKLYGKLESKIRKVALCGGSGASFIKDAIEKEADLYITGDIKYHDAQEAVDNGLMLIDAGHYHTEKIILYKLEEILKEEFGEDLELEIYSKSSPSYGVY